MELNNLPIGTPIVINETTKATVLELTESAYILGQLLDTDTTYTVPRDTVYTKNDIIQVDIENVL